MDFKTVPDNSALKTIIDVCVCIFVLLLKATPVDKPQLGYMVNKLHKMFKLYIDDSLF